MRAPRLASLLLATSLLPSLAAAATLRGMVSLSDGVVRLADLFDDAGPNAERVLGPAPPPGGRITVPARQLAAIARQYGVAWQPLSADDEVVLERPARSLARTEIIDALRGALVEAGAGADCAVALNNFVTPAVATDTNIHPMVEQIDFDAATSHFTATIGLATAGQAPQHVRVSGHAWPMVDVPVAAARITPGAPIHASDLRIQRMRADQLHGDVVRDPAEADGMMLHHTVLGGQPLLRADLIRPPLVARGAPVRMTLDQPGISLTLQGQALQDGGMGAVVRVLNPSSSAVLDAEVTGPQTVRVTPGSLPETGPQPPGMMAAGAAP